MSVSKIMLYSNRTLSCALVINIKNSPEIRNKLLSGSLNCAIVKPHLIAEMFQIYVAANKALLAESANKLTTKSVYTEILFNLSISKNISQSLLTFGISDTDTEMIILSFADDKEMSEILSYIEGDVVNITELQEWTKKANVIKTYKIKEEEIGVSNLINLIVSKISTKELMSH